MTTTPEPTYADMWADAINETYPADVDVLADTLDDGDVLTVLTQVANALRRGIPATFTGPELDVVRHLMPAYEVHQSGAVRWVLDNYGPSPE